MRLLGEQVARLLPSSWVRLEAIHVRRSSDIVFAATARTYSDKRDDGTRYALDGARGPVNLGGGERL